MNDIQFQKNYSALISPVYTPQQAGPVSSAQKAGSPKAPFSQILKEAIQQSSTGLTFSKHAMERLDSRQISVSPQLMEKMSDAVQKAESKGVTEALMLNGNTAFIVNIPNRTVVTTMNGGEMKDNIFTNINGAVIL